MLQLYLITDTLSGRDIVASSEVNTIINGLFSC